MVHIMCKNTSELYIYIYNIYIYVPGSQGFVAPPPPAPRWYGSASTLCLLLLILELLLHLHMLSSIIPTRESTMAVDVSASENLSSYVTVAAVMTYSSPVIAFMQQCQQHFRMHDALHILQLILITMQSDACMRYDIRSVPILMTLSPSTHLIPHTPTPHHRGGAGRMSCTHPTSKWGWTHLHFHRGGADPEP